MQPYEGLKVGEVASWVWGSWIGRRVQAWLPLLIKRPFSVGVLTEKHLKGLDDETDKHKNTSLSWLILGTSYSLQATVFRGNTDIAGVRFFLGYAGGWGKHLWRQLDACGDQHRGHNLTNSLPPILFTFHSTLSSFPSSPLTCFSHQPWYIFRNGRY